MQLTSTINKLTWYLPERPQCQRQYMQLLNAYSKYKTFDMAFQNIKSFKLAFWEKCKAYILIYLWFFPENEIECLYVLNAMHSGCIFIYA